MQPVVSLIVPFYNAERNSVRLLATLRKLRVTHVEAILVDDGSSDSTLELLNEVAQAATIPITVLSHDNRGPGGARNAGFQVAQGDYVWFVDCDDDIHEAALEALIEHSGAGYDFVDFNVSVNDRANENSMGWDSGPHIVTDQNRSTLARGFGRIHSKAIRREWLRTHDVAYPEYCLYEDTPFFCELPFLTQTFFKSDLVGYVQHLEFDSVTRGGVSPRYFDRLWTMSLGLEQGLALALPGDERNALVDQFVEKFVVRVFQQLTARLFTPRSPLSSVLASKNASKIVREIRIRAELGPRMRRFNLMLRVMARFRSEARRLKVSANFSEQIRQLSGQERLVFRAMWCLSYLTRNSPRYFEKLRLEAWGRAFAPSPDVRP